MKINNIVDVGRWRMCVGCGGCASVCPEQKIGLVDVENDGIRPVMMEDRETGRRENGKAGKSGECEDCRLCLEVCPGISKPLDLAAPRTEGIPQLKKQWGSVLEVWEGHALDREARFKGSSGGLCTALSFFLLGERFGRRGAAGRRRP